MTSNRLASGPERRLAWAFGTYLNLDSAPGIGLLPRFPGARCLPAGNAAGAGARAAPLAVTERERAKRIAGRVRCAGLTTFPGFQRLFAHATQFPEFAGG